MSSHSQPVEPMRHGFREELDQLRLQVELMGVRVDENLERMREGLRSGDSALAALAFEQDGNDLAGLTAHTNDSGEGRWTIEDATNLDVPTPVITTSLYARFYTRGNGDFTGRVLSALRNQFGGHAVTSSAGSTDKGADSPGADAVAPVPAEPDVSEGAVRGEPGTPPEA